VNQVKIKKIERTEEPPFDLLLLADPSMEVIKSYIERGICYALEKENKIIGVYVLIETRPLTYELVNIAIDSKHQGNGYGKMMIFDAIEKAKSFGAKVLEVGTGNSGISQLALYQKCGFKIKGIDHDFFKRHYSEKIIENGIECIDMIRLSMDF